MVNNDAFVHQVLKFRMKGIVHRYFKVPHFLRDINVKHSQKYEKNHPVVKKVQCSLIELEDIT